jgi:hypothetical protein
MTKVEIVKDVTKTEKENEKPVIEVKTTVENAADKLSDI